MFRAFWGLSERFWGIQILFGTLFEMLVVLRNFGYFELYWGTLAVLGAFRAFGHLIEIFLT